MIVHGTRFKSVDRLVFSPDGTTIAAAGGNGEPIELIVTTGESARRLLKVHLVHAYWNYGFTPQGLLIVADIPDVVGFDAPTGDEFWRIEPEESFVIAGLDVTPDGQHMALGLLHKNLSGSVFQVWKLNGSEAPERVRTIGDAASHMGWVVVILPFGDRVIAVGPDPEAGTTRLNVLSTTHGSARAYSTEWKFIERVAASPGGRFLAATNRRAILVWPTTFDHPPTKLINNTRLHFTDVAFHPSDRYLAATSNDETVKLYDTATWTVAKTFTWNIGRLRSVAFSGDGLLAAAGSDTGTVVVWDVDV